MFFHLFTTTECNLECKYCFGEALEDTVGDFGFDVDYGLPRHIVYNMDYLKRFCSLDPEPVLIFYGGEPLLYAEGIRRIMDHVIAKHFLIQTNGLLLDSLEPRYVNRFTAILVSLDGDESLTDFYRGKGVHRKVIENLKLVRSRGFRGEIIARMTVMEQTDIYKQVLWLLQNEGFPFSSVHWQINAGFWSHDFERRGFAEWSKSNYTPGIIRLAEFWVNTMERKGIVLRLYPFLGITHSLLSGEEKCGLRCGAGWMNYSIQTDGTIIPCPAMWGIRKYYLGHIKSSHPLRLPKISVGEPCISCRIYGLCGGRCLYANITKRWNSAAYRLVCETVENTIEAIKAQLPRIKTLIKAGKIRIEDFNFMKYNGCEIIP